MENKNISPQGIAVQMGYFADLASKKLSSDYIENKNLQLESIIKQWCHFLLGEEILLMNFLNLSADYVENMTYSSDAVYAAHEFSKQKDEWHYIMTRLDANDLKIMHLATIPQFMSYNIYSFCKLLNVSYSSLRRFFYAPYKSKSISSNINLLLAEKFKLYVFYTKNNVYVMPITQECMIRIIKNTFANARVKFIELKQFIDHKKINIHQLAIEMGICYNSLYYWSKNQTLNSKIWPMVAKFLLKKYGGVMVYLCSQNYLIH